MAAIRRLGPGDEPLLTELAREEAAFDLEGRGRAREPVVGTRAAEYLADPDVLHWVAEDEGAVVGHLLCYLQRRRAGEPVQLMLYEVGVRDSHRRQGIGRALVAEMDTWMEQNAVTDAWVLADNDGAEKFYAACGFAPDDPQPVQMSRLPQRLVRQE
jgi:predicted N-acetyltransferase YhbS